MNFSVTNHGSYPVRISINKEVSKLIQPGKTGHVSVNIGLLGKNCTFAAAPQGGSLNIGYSILQRP